MLKNGKKVNERSEEKQRNGEKVGEKKERN